MSRGVSILGSTGSIGTSTLEVIAALPDQFHIVALTAGRNVDLLVQQARRFRPRYVAVRDSADVATVREALGGGVSVGCGDEALVEAASLAEAEIVVTAVVGSVGITATLASLRQGKRVALANKESLVAGGRLVMQAAREGTGEIIPVDSEHSAVFQCLQGEKPGSLRRVLLTASGGPFRTWSIDEMKAAGVSDALRHPTWQMGGKITIDSATLMNKGLEVIEAHWLFGVDIDDIEVVVHPQSIIHSMIEMVDGSIIAQLGAADMKGPIQYALTYPSREVGASAPLSLADVGRLTFESPDSGRFPCLRLAYQAGRVGGTAPAVLSAANEVAVASFLEGRIGFMEIARCVEHVLSRHDPATATTLDEVLAADAWARSEAEGYLMREQSIL